MNFAVYKPLPHYAGDSMAAGEALYIDDLPAYQSMKNVVLSNIVNEKWL